MTPYVFINPVIIILLVSGYCFVASVSIVCSIVLSKGFQHLCETTSCYHGYPTQNAQCWVFVRVATGADEVN